MAFEHALQLRRSWYERILIEPTEAPGEAKTRTVGEFDLQFSDDLTLWLVHLVVRTGFGEKEEEGETEKAPPYRIDIHAAGAFHLTKPGPDLATVLREVGINAATILYASTRELVLQLTSRSRYGPLMLPTMDFQDFQPEIPEGMDEERLKRLAAPVADQGAQGNASS